MRKRARSDEERVQRRTALALLRAEVLAEREERRGRLEAARRARLEARQTVRRVKAERDLSAQQARDLATRERLLAAGRRLFVEKGFQKVTVREIAQEARANLAAVSYHFRDKLGLYLEVLQQAIDAAQDVFESLSDSPEGLPAEERLRRYVRATLQRMAELDEATVAIQQLMRHEALAPTAAMPFIVERASLPRIRYAAQIVAELLGCPRDDVRVGIGVASIHAQHLFHMRNPFRDIAYADWRLSAVSLDRLADYITEYALGGIKALAASKKERGAG